jgi:hypothetical protein
MSLQNDLKAASLKSVTAAVELANKQLQIDQASDPDLKNVTIPPIVVSDDDVDQGTSADAIEKAIKTAVNASIFSQSIATLQAIMVTKYGYVIDTETGLLKPRIPTADEITTEAVLEIQSFDPALQLSNAHAQQLLQSLKADSSKTFFRKSYQQWIDRATQTLQQRFAPINTDVGTINTLALQLKG